MKQVKYFIVVKIMITVPLIKLKRKTTNQCGKHDAHTEKKTIFSHEDHYVNAEIGKLDSKILHTVQRFIAF